ncbi:hypothetical protein N7495_005721 [Penicillium taxi]|uniref:uncharacterized protein n=1 Tax=Penicillium taxi TaxID=168475 RepID=UPI0025456A34|nr:uncharacterized protein N7495_005721 [Penicillium taxi]KAJ5894030.1 hypothetical protein N7495_005721 [Penicillium taxi]
MRPGLDKPGALPLLALIVFSLLTLVPSLSNIYNLKLADFPFASGARQVPLIQDNVDIPSDSLLSDTRKSWYKPALPHPCGNRIPRSSRWGNGASTIFSETATVANESRSSYASESSFLFSRRARAFRTYFIQQLDGYQLFTHFSSRNVTAKTASLDPTITSSTRPPLQTSYNKQPDHASNTPIKSNTSTTEKSELQVLYQYSAWQQACRAAISLWDIAKDAPYIPALIHGSNYIESIIHMIPQSLNLLNTSIPPRPLTNASNSTAVQTPKSHIVPGEQQSTDAAGRHSPELQGSCMAVVIGLVAGIVWF